MILDAPLAPNRNRAGTAFAGSLNAVATLAGWAWLTLAVRGLEPEPQVVLQDSAITYHRPAESAFRATCAAPPAEEIERFTRTLARRGRARLRLTVGLLTKAGTAATFTGRYVVTPGSAGA